MKLCLTKESLAEFYVKWNRKLVNSLSALSRDVQANEEAVLVAFTKTMEKPLDAFGHVPENEGELYLYLLNHAKGELSHFHRRRDTRIKYERLAFEHMGVVREVERKSRSLVSDGFGTATLISLAREAGIKSVNLKAYIDCYLNDEPTEEVSRRYGIKANALYAIRHRIDRMLRERGPERYEALVAAA